MHQFFFGESANAQKIVVDVGNLSLQVSLGNYRFPILQDVFVVADRHIRAHVFPNPLFVLLTYEAQLRMVGGMGPEDYGVTAKEEVDDRQHSQHFLRNAFVWDSEKDETFSGDIAI
jgi:hypothetical protein